MFLFIDVCLRCESNFQFHDGSVPRFGTCVSSQIFNCWELKHCNSHIYLLFTFDLRDLSDKAQPWGPVSLSHFSLSISFTFATRCLGSFINFGTIGFGVFVCVSMFKSMTDDRERLINSKYKVQQRYDMTFSFTATSMIIGTKSQWFPSPLSTSIDFDSLIVTSSSNLFLTTIYLRSDNHLKAAQQLKFLCKKNISTLLHVFFLPPAIGTRYIKKCNFVVRFSKIKECRTQTCMPLPSISKWIESTWAPLRNWLFARILAS